MGLPASQERLLDRIEETLKQREPRLASMFAMFARLNINERLPRTEALVAVPWWSPRRYGSRLLVRALLLFSLLAVLTASGVLLGPSRRPVSCQAAVAAHGVRMVQSRRAAAAAGSPCTSGRQPKPGPHGKPPSG
jgi:hypothetical protein